MFEIVLLRNGLISKKSINLKSLDELYSPSNITADLPPFKLHENLLNHLTKKTKILIPYNDGEDFIYSYINEKFHIVPNKNHSALLGKHFKNIFPLLVDLGIYDLLKEVYLSGKEIKFSLEIYADEILTSSFQYILFKDEDMIFSISEDTTEISLLNPAEKQIYDSTIQGVLELRPNGEVTRFNKTAQEITGYSIHDLNLKGITECILELNNLNSEIKTVGDVLKKLNSGEILFSDSEVKIKIKDGTEKWVKTHSNKLKRHKNIIQTTFVDISSRKKAENEASILRENLEISQKISKSGNFFINKTDEFIYTPGLYGILEKERTNNDKYENIVLNALFPEDKLKLLNICSSMNLDNSCAIFEGKLKTETNKIKYIKSYLTKVFKENGENTISCFIQDITNQKVVKNEAIKLKDVLDVVEPKTEFAMNWWNKDLKYESTSKLFDILETGAPKDFKYDKDILLDYIDPDYLLKFKKDYASFINGEKDELELNLPIITEKNNKKYIYIYKKALDKCDGKVFSYVGYIQDITEKELLRNREHDYFDKSIQGLGIIKNNQFIKVNNSFIDILHINEQKIINNSLNFDKYSIEGINESEFIDLCDKIESKKLYFYDGVLIKNKNQWIKFHAVPTEYMGDSAILITIIDVTEETLNEMELNKSKKEKELLLGEIHDRVKNNLQIIVSLLRLEERFHSESSGKVSKDAVNRIEALALVHENAYDSNEFTQIHIKEFIQNQLFYLINSNGFTAKDINLSIEIDPNLVISIEYMTHLSLIINEIFNNSLIYAFTEDEVNINTEIEDINNSNFNVNTNSNIESNVDMNSYNIINNNNNNNNNINNNEIYCNFSVENGIAKVIIKDNGKGLPEGLDINTPKTLSFTIINLLTLQLEGKIQNIQCEGTGYYLEFSVNLK